MVLRHHLYQSFYLLQWTQYSVFIKSYQTWLFISYIALVLLFSLQPADNFSLFKNIWKYDKIVHLVEYFGVGFLLINAMKIKPISTRKWRYAIMFLLIFPIIDELLQYYTPRRIPDLYDCLADIIGGLIGALIRKKY